jgi:glucuronoarabinoxylan endo-1,4-beta-xylanase
MYDKQTKIQSKNKHIWMTEHFINGKDDKAIMKTAKDIHDALTIAGCSAYIAWWMYEKSPDELFYDKNNNLTAKAYVLAQFAKFIRPGFVKLNLEDCENKDILISAYIGKNKVNN